LKVIENFLPPSLCEIVKQELLNDFFPWYFNDTIAYKNYIPYSFQFTHNFYSNDTVNSDWYRTAQSVLFIIEEKLNVRIKRVIRIKANLNTQNPLLNPIDNIHQDLPEESGNAKFMTLLYYVNDRDGDTLIFDDDKENISNRITPQENKALWFESQSWHCSSPPIENKRRVVINFILEVE
jgi:hypothetical protein